MEINLEETLNKAQRKLEERLKQKRITSDQFAKKASLYIDIRRKNEILVNPQQYGLEGDYYYFRKKINCSGEILVGENLAFIGEIRDLKDGMKKSIGYPSCIFGEILIGYNLMTMHFNRFSTDPVDITPPIFYNLKTIKKSGDTSIEGEYSGKWIFGRYIFDPSRITGKANLRLSKK